MKRLNKAFTLTELLVALGVIGVLCAILLPIIFNIMPSQNTIMAKRAYYIVQSVVSDLINDEACYPDLTNASISEQRKGFDDGYGYPNCDKWGGTENTYTTNHDNAEPNANLKFATLFTDKLDLSGSVSPSATGTTFTTKDGIQWAIHNMGYGTKNDEDASAIITVDVNGKNSPNCDQAAGNGGASYSSYISGYESCNGRVKGFDRFSMYVYADGRITIYDPDVWAINAVQVDRNITGDGTQNSNDDKL